MSDEVTGVYSNSQIRAAISRGHIVFYPFVDEHINGSSVDVTLGNWFYRSSLRKWTMDNGKLTIDNGQCIIIYLSSFKSI